MKFHEYTTMYNALGGRIAKNGPRLSEGDFWKQGKQLFEDGFKAGIVSQHDKDERQTQSECEHWWMAHKRPYYSIYPAVTKSLLAVKLDLDCSLIKMPVFELLLRFPVGNEPIRSGERYIKSCLAVGAKSPAGLMVQLLIEDDGSDKEDKSKIRFLLKHGITVEESLNRVEDWDNASPDFKRNIESVIRTFCAVCLLGDDPDIIKPDVLNEHQRQFDETGDFKYVEHARKRGKVGWLVGSQIETCPHYRRPHLALRWTGEGHAIPKIVPVKGAIVHRNKLTDVPMGYLDNEKNKPAE